MDYEIKSLSEYVECIQTCRKKIYEPISKSNDMILFRGHGNFSWKLLPKIFRKKEWFENEMVIINEILRQCPESFKNLTPFETLVKMQHYGMPTRLLDLTGNPLIALYFACNDITQESEDGAVLIVNFPMFYENHIPVSSFLTKLFPESDNLFVQINKDSLDTICKNSIAVGIIPKLENYRIKNQDGYFILFTYIGEYETVFNPIEANNSIKDRIIIPSQYKKRILDELYICGIKESFVYPELENQIKCIVKKYSI